MVKLQSQITSSPTLTNLIHRKKENYFLTEATCPKRITPLFSQEFNDFGLLKRTKKGHIQYYVNIYFRP